MSHYDDPPTRVLHSAAVTICDHPDSFERVSTRLEVSSLAVHSERERTIALATVRIDCPLDAPQVRTWVVNSESGRQECIAWLADMTRELSRLKWAVTSYGNSNPEDE